MANRAYLFCTDVIDESIWWNRDRKYYDSRWQIPLAWFFFFSVEDLHWWKVRENRVIWDDLKLWTKKEEALKQFSRRRQTLETLIKDRLDIQVLDRFKQEIISLKGIYLVLDPIEIFDGASWHADAIRQVLKTIDTGEPTAILDLAELTHYFQFSDDPDRWELNVIGCTY